MIIDNIFLNNFRNLKNLSLKFSKSGLLIYGKNGSGKTNLLEALSYFSFGKSFRFLSDSDLVEFGKTDFFLKGGFTVSDASVSIKIKVTKDRKQIYINDNLIKKTNELYKFIKVVYFSPVDIEIVIGYPANRRRFFDVAISQYNFKYLELLRQYNRVLKQRNALLKKDFTDNEKKIWDKQFVFLSTQIIKTRLEYLQLFNEQLTGFYKKISGNDEKTSIIYQPKYTVNEKDIESSLIKQLNTKAEDEKIYQRTLIGPHLHEYGFYLNNLPLKKFGSQGQKRSFVIALRLSQAKLIDISYNDPPILIFDDILSELDSERSHNIFDMLGNEHQIFIATPNKAAYSSLNLPMINLEKLLREDETK